jgi:hypothetical protein
VTCGRDEREGREGERGWGFFKLECLREIEMKRIEVEGR